MIARVKDKSMCGFIFGKTTKEEEDFIGGGMGIVKICPFYISCKKIKSEVSKRREGAPWIFKSLCHTPSSQVT